LQFSVRNWSVWPEHLGSSLTAWTEDANLPATTQNFDITFVDVMSRRRLGRLSRMALHVAQQASMDCDGVATVFASRHGELARSLAILQDLANDEPPSPAAFSLSVHNATSGIYSIARANQAAACAIAAGEETLLWALQEACLRLQLNTPVLLVYADEPLPEAYARFDDDQAPAHAVALLLAPGSEFALTWQANLDQPASPEPLSLAFAHCLANVPASLHWTGQRLAVMGGHPGRAH
jgi:hypothetical protein